MADATIGIRIDPSDAVRGARTVKKSLDDVKQSGREATAAVDRLGGRGRDSLGRFTKGAGQASVAASRFGRIGGTAFQQVQRGAAGAVSSVANLRTALVGIGAGLALRKVIGDFADFERGLIGVGKTTGIEGANLAALGRGVQEISRTVPVATTELLSLAQAAGQLGVKGNDNILRFTETVGKLGQASDLSGDAAATALARILTVTGTAIEDVDRLGATIVHLGNNFAATESEIAHVATRVAQSTAQFDVSADAVLGIATAIKAVGGEAEAGGSVIGRAFQAINDAVRQGGEEMQAMTEITGMAQEELRKLFMEDSTAAFEVFIKGLNRIQEAGGDVASALDQVGLNGVRVVANLGTLAKRADVLSDALRQGSQAWQANIALNQEALVASESFTAQMQLVANAVNESAVIIGRELAPEILKATDAFRDFLLEAAETGRIKAFARDTADAFALIAENIELVAIAAGTLIGLRFGAVLGPWGAIIGGIAGALGTLALQQGGATEAAKLHKVALGDLKDAIDQAESSTEGYTEKTDKLTAAHGRAALAAVQSARQQLEAAREIVVAEITSIFADENRRREDMGVRLLGPEDLQNMVATDDRIRGLTTTLGQNRQRLKEVRDTIDGLTGDYIKFGEAGKEAGDKIKAGADTASSALNKIATQYTVVAEEGGTATMVVRRHGQAQEEAAEKTKKAKDTVKDLSAEYDVLNHETGEAEGSTIKVARAMRDSAAASGDAKTGANALSSSYDGLGNSADAAADKIFKLVRAITSVPKEDGSGMTDITVSGGSGFNGGMTAPGSSDPSGATPFGQLPGGVSGTFDAATFHQQQSAANQLSSQSSGTSDSLVGKTLTFKTKDRLAAFADGGSFWTGSGLSGDRATVTTRQNPGELNMIFNDKQQDTLDGFLTAMSLADQQRDSVSHLREIANNTRGLDATTRAMRSMGGDVFGDRSGVSFASESEFVDAAIRAAGQLGVSTSDPRYISAMRALADSGDPLGKSGVSFPSESEFVDSFLGTLGQLGDRKSQGNDRSGDAIVQRLDRLIAVMSDGSKGKGFTFRDLNMPIQMVDPGNPNSRRQAALDQFAELQRAAR